MIDWYLEAANGDADLIQIVELKDFRSYSVGRKRDFDIISLNPLVSRTHGLFKHKVNNKIYVYDSNSSNGIWVNDVKITPAQDHLLNENDLIGIGSPSSAQEARLELFRLRGTHLRSDSVDIPELKLKEENKHTETTTSTVSNVNSSPDNKKLVSTSPKVSKNEEDNTKKDVKPPNRPDKTKKVTAQDTSSCGHAIPLTLGVVKIENNLKDDKKHPVDLSQSKNKEEHVFSFPEDESEHIIPKYERGMKNSKSKIINVDQQPYEEKIFQHNSVKIKSVVPYKGLIPVVRLDRLEFPLKKQTLADKPKKKLEVISSSSSDEEDDTKHKRNAKYSTKIKKDSDKLSVKKTLNVSSVKESDEHKKHDKLISKSKPKQTESSSCEKVKRTASLFEELFGETDPREKHVEKSACKQGIMSSTSSSSTEKSRVKHVEKSIGKERKLSSNSSSSIEKSRVKHVDKSTAKDQKLSSTTSSSTDKFRVKHVDKSTDKEQKLSSTSSSSTEKSKVQHVDKSTAKDQKLSSTSSNLTEKSRVKHVDKSIGKERKLSSTSSSSIEKLITSLASASKLKSTKKSASNTFIYSSSSEDEPICSKILHSREKPTEKPTKSKEISDSSSHTDKSSPTNEITHSTDKPVSPKRSEEVQLKTETTDPISLESKTSEMAQKNGGSTNAKVSIAKDLFADGGDLKVVKSESRDLQEASTSKAVPSVEEVRTIKQEIFDERELNAERQPSPIMCASPVSISSESDTPSPKVSTAVDNNGSFSTSCDVGEIICLSDDDDIFPKSQMFDDDVTVKAEPLTNIDNGREAEDVTIKSEQHSQHDEYPMQEHVDNVFGIIKKDVEFDDDAILIEDDDDNDEVDSLWYSRLSQPGYSNSQLEDQEERFDDKNIISIRTGPKVVNFLDDKDLITSEPTAEEVAAQLQREIDLHEQAAPVLDEADLIDDSVPICVITHSYQPPFVRSTTVQEQAADEGDATLKLDEIKSKIASKKSFAIPPVIDAPHLIKGRRKTTEEIKPKELNKRGRKRKQSVDERATSAVVPPAPVRTFGTGTNLDKSVINELQKRHKRRRHSTDILPPDKKQEIHEKRMKELKKIAQNCPAEDKKQDDKPKTTAKPYIKLSSSRGLFLTDKETEKRKIRVKTPSELEPVAKKKFVIPRKKVEETGKPEEDVNTLAVPSTSKDMTHQIPNTVTAEENQNASTEKTMKKRVTFNDTPQIRVYIIDEGNHMNKCTSKDAPLPRKVIQTVPSTRITDDSPENLVLCDILSWVPLWLEEQKKFNVAPKLSMHKPIQMLHTFNTHGDYRNIVEPLLLLELWRSVFRDWVNTRRPVILACIDDVQSMRISRTHMLSIHCHSLITRVDSDRCLHPVRGDLLVIEILLGDTARQCAVIKKMGYVVDITKRRLNANDLIDTKLIYTPTIPEFLVHYKIMVKDFNTEINRDSMVRIRAVSRIGTSLRIFKSVSLLNQSALCKFILNPQVNDYTVPKLTKTKLLVPDKLDIDQVKCMIEACQICVRPAPGIYMVQGPPGTGKSCLIKNIVYQLLYGERKAGMKSNCILLCAPSNGAIDELAQKLLQMRQSMPQNRRFKMVRLGPPNSIHPKVKPVSLPCLVESFVKKQLKREPNDAVLDDLNFRQSKVNMLENKLVSLRDRKLYTKDVEIQLQKAKNDLELFHIRSNKEMTYQERNKLERKSEETIITKADIVCSTLSSCVAFRMEELHRRKLLRFTCCIIDEATQSSEQETLIPLTLGINKLILVGDPAQLPATVLSQEAKQLGYGNSLFYRIQKCFEHLPENPIRMLKTQYRMHPEICKFPNEHFYFGKLINSSAFIDNRDANNACHRYRVFALRAPQQHGAAAHAYLNVPEARLVMALCKLVLARTGYSVGIITPYTVQREYLQRGLEEITKETDKQNDRVTVNTVDGFQGQERDVIIMSCVRHNSNMFLADEQRLNVSLTRAKHALFICADAELFKNNDIWTKLERDAMKRHCLKYLTETDYENEMNVTSLIYKS
ncbi:Senataxin [Carabus blaptoides fortunei]